MKIYLYTSVVAVASIALAACVVEVPSNGGGGGGGGTTPPAPAPAPIFQTQWVGTAPFCAASPGSCTNLGAGWQFVERSTTGNGARCASGVKVLCRRQVN
ncbi:MAG: hypothetical protein AAFO77_01850 [Pseudomonadota bacterium]